MTAVPANSAYGYHSLCNLTCPLNLLGVPPQQNGLLWLRVGDGVPFSLADSGIRPSQLTDPLIDPPTKWPFTLNVIVKRSLLLSQCLLYRLIYIIHRHVSSLFSFICNMLPNFLFCLIQDQLTNLGTEGMLPKTSLSESQLENFLHNPPLGMSNIIRLRIFWHHTLSEKSAIL